MHIPTMDSERQKRVGVVSEGPATMVLKAHVRTEDTEERGAYDPVEGMARPFPMLLHTGGEGLVLEDVIDEAVLTPFSDTLVEYVALLCESANNGEWIDGIYEFEDDDFEAGEVRIASSLFGFLSQDVPIGLWNSVYKEAKRLVEGKKEFTGSNSLRDIDGRERYGFDYIPGMDEVDEWTLKHSHIEYEVENEEDTAVSTSVWLRYKVGDSEEERPLISFQNDVAGATAQSPSVDFGATDMDDAPDKMVRKILDGSSDLNVDSESLSDTRTEEYLMGYID